MNNLILFITCKVQRVTDKLMGIKRNQFTCPKTGETIKNNIKRNYKASEKLWRDNTTNDLEAMQRIKDAGNLTGCLLGAVVVAFI